MNVLALMLLGAGGMTFIALLLGYLFDLPFLTTIRLDAIAVIVGLTAALPPIAALHWFSSTRQPVISNYRLKQVEFLAGLGIEFTFVRSLCLALAAGISEELLFRGALLELATTYGPLWLSVLITSVLFGLLHWRGWAYVIIAGTMGLYFAAIYLYTDNIVAPITTHAFYDLAAFLYAQRAIEHYCANNAQHGQTKAP